MSDACVLTGGTGFIGGHLAQRLIAGGLEVRCLVRERSDTTALERLGVELVRGDLTDPTSLSSAVEGCRYVVHCAALVSDWATVAEIRRVNVQGTRALLGATAQAGAERFLHVSSTDVYGYPGTPALDETFAGARFRNWYAQTKLEAETEVRAAERSRRLEAVILRPATVYGPGSRDVVGEIAQAIRGGHMILIGGGRADAGLCYVTNLADAALLALLDESAGGHAFNVTDGLDVTWGRFTADLAAGLGSPAPRWSLPYPLAVGLGTALERGYRLLRRSTGVTLPPLLSRQAVHVLGRSQSFSSEKLRRQLGWQPRVDYPEGLAATMSWLREDFLTE